MAVAIETEQYEAQDLSKYTDTELRQMFYKSKITRQEIAPTAFCVGAFLCPRSRIIRYSKSEISDNVGNQKFIFIRNGAKKVLKTQGKLGKNF